jgi:hypothetical protein
MADDHNQPPEATPEGISSAESAQEPENEHEPVNLSDSDTTEDDAGKVGYRKPPKSGRFKPGRSGNPRGRKTGARNLRTYLREELARSVRVPVDGGQRNMPKVQLIAKQLVNASIKGNLKSIEFLLKLVDLMAPGESEGEAPRPMSDQERQLLLDFLSSVDTATKTSSKGDVK